MEGPYTIRYRVAAIRHKIRPFDITGRLLGRMRKADTERTVGVGNESERTTRSPTIVCVVST
jgi:hypothetical protein